VPPTEKAYKNLSFLNGPGARGLRILCEYEEPQDRFRHERVRDTIVMFGSARVKPRAVSQALYEEARSAYDAEPEGSPTREPLAIALAQAEKTVRLSRYYDATRELAARLTRWSVERPKGRRYLICTGGGPGIMEAGNRGAADVPGGRSVGLGISLPFEEKVNEYVSPSLAFEFHYFFMRKYWFAYLAKAMVIMPGGFGTLDEMAEILTLRQTGKIKKPLPMVLFGRDYWDSVLNVAAMVDWGTISPRDVALMHHTDSVDDAFTFLTEQLTLNESEDRG
jgi:hypothetical protein